MSSTGILFEDLFQVTQLNPTGKKFDRVNRLACKAVTFEMDLLLDINSEIYTVRQNDKLSLVLSSTLALDGAPDDGTYRPIEHEETLASRYEYVMHGRVFKYEQLTGTQVQVSASFGGLLMRLTGEQRHLVHISIDQRIYLLIRQNRGA
ncbi:RNA polymerase [Tribonema minus]|uniref:DNA-directed RNA polymerases I, II, and III subunit RPABC3 n=1 Tax=Tribonema minus TaxID=303371 RepID=A0A836CD84_9STRA|nr:RNA polymerase [Tribonema minus]|eukprot:TRINITY_DN24988_c0_g1_i1.p1 TRINITY_DN24988_c0_g1~~TRINITY_DN24988_c0_g1_i1.p1  ORF type:complete len:149 (-),score=38.36 TRINITY_DN24988_c0_g1_i1:37-483(-)